MHVCRPLEIVREEVGSLLYEYHKVHGITEPVSVAPKKLRGHWIPPPAGQLCLSVDAAIFANLGVIGTGAVILTPLRFTSPDYQNRFFQCSKGSVEGSVKRWNTVWLRVQAVFNTR
ncbi:hypothetical protein PanWU01x14_231360 [Parasponia andersonii]|uniref:Uncharacterized protein n=1 Tax=Parasponia andersonii TaxID=3476 RepID=A0A2P5BKE6_PARAD|nr:hypothetical protein PanWU01x14_231360 [Parasponia andersonii]